MNEDMRILCVDPGDKRIGLAISDQTGTIANPLRVILHVKREKDAKAIASIAEEYGVKVIVVGMAISENGEISFSGRKAQRLAGAIQLLSVIPVKLWDESNSTNEAQIARRKMGVKQKNRKGHMDDLAATVILQSYLDAHVSEIQAGSHTNLEQQ
jgi:putative Holliday junction resolvase